jgi:hypothetical protein
VLRLDSPQPIERQISDDPHQEGPGIVDSRRIDSGPAKPGFLHDVLRVSDTTQNAVRDAEQERPLRIEDGFRRVSIH